MVHERLDYVRLDLNDLLPVEVVGVKIIKGFDPITLISVYVPPGQNLSGDIRTKIQEFFQTVEQLREVFIGGDFNGQHRSWDPTSMNCPKGNLINSLLDPSRLVLLNDDSPTCLTTVNRSSSAIDLSLATTGLAMKSSWKVVPQEFGSNHLSIQIEIGSDLPIIPGKITRINKSKAAEIINRLKPQYIYNPDEMQSIFEESCEEASYVVSDKKANYLKRWWSKEIEEAYKIKRKLLRVYNKSETTSNYLNLQKGGWC